eukprot:12664730-Ditylum_brightwellii.AAC.1
MPTEEECDLSFNNNNDFIQVDKKVNLSFDDDDNDFLPPPNKVCTKGHPALQGNTCTTKGNCGGVYYAGILNGQPCQAMSDCTI